MTARYLAASLVAILVPGIAAAQSLAEIARQEAARRNETVKPSRAFSNADLKADPTDPAADDPVAAAAPRGFLSLATGDYVSAEEIIARSQAALAAREAATGDDKRAETYWRERARRIRGDRDKARRQVETLAAAAPSSSAERAVTDKAMTRARATLDDLEKQWLKLTTQAGAANIPKAWLQ